MPTLPWTPLPAAAGVNLKFITKPAYFIGYFDVDGVPDPPNEGQLLVATKLTLAALTCRATRLPLWRASRIC